MCCSKRVVFTCLEFLKTIFFLGLVLKNMTIRIHVIFWHRKEVPFLTNSLRDSVSQKKLTQLLRCSSQRLYLFSQECSKTISCLEAAQFINMTSTHSPNSFLTRLHGKAAQIRAPRQSRQKARFLKMPLEKDNPKHRDTSNNLDEMFKDSNVWNKVDDLLFLTRIFFFRIRL